jgi:hypothetical protein
MKVIKETSTTYKGTDNLVNPKLEYMIAVIEYYRATYNGEIEKVIQTSKHKGFKNNEEYTESMWNKGYYHRSIKDLKVYQIKELLNLYKKTFNNITQDILYNIKRTITCIKVLLYKE